MNYIKQLQEENKILKSQIVKIKIEIADFITFLHSDKFIGTESDGARKDWIATGDVINRMREFRGFIEMS